MEENTAMEERVSTTFLRNITNPDLYWTFELIGRKKISGKIVTFLQTATLTPITLMVDDGEEEVEIPWTSILTIKPGKK